MNYDDKLLGLFINGQWIRKTDKCENVVNPATGKTLAQLPHAGPTELQQVVASAKAGFDVWKKTPAETRAKIMQKAVNLLRERAKEIGTIMTMEQGKPLKEAIAEVNRCANIIEWDLNQALRIYGQVIAGKPGYQRLTIRQPIGPVAAFTPWNFPASVLARKVGGALAAGCSLVLKAAEETPGTACAVAQCFQDANLPAGVLNLVFGVPAEISSYLIAHDEIRAVTFTGSVPVGKLLAALAGTHMKPVVMELGGSSPVIVCNDTDARLAARIIAAAKFRNAGQICTAPARFIVQGSVYEEFIDEFAKYASSLKVGDGLLETTQMGPLANERRVRAMVNLVEDAIKGGASLRSGGKRIGMEGNFFQPTVIADVPLNADLMTQETFGPIAPIVKFNTLDEAISIANGTPFGLAGYAFTESSASAHRLYEEVDVGILSINHGEGSVPEAPFGGVRNSGHGREGGEESLYCYTTTKFISHRGTIN